MPPEIPVTQLPQLAPIGGKTDSFAIIERAFTEAASKIHVILEPFAVRIFFSLLAFQLLLLAFQWVLGRKSPQEFLGDWATFLLRTGFFLVLLKNPEWLLAIPKSFGAIGRAISPVEVNPSAMIDAGLKVSTGITGSLGKTGLFGIGFASIIGAICAVFCILAFALLAGHMLVTVVEIAVMGNLASILIMFSGLQQTRYLAMQYINLMIGSGLKLLVIYIVNAVAINFGEIWSEYAIENFSDSIQAMFVLLASSLVLAWLGFHLPRLASSLASGSPSVGAAGLGGLLGVTAGAIARGSGSAGAAAGGVAEAGRGNIVARAAQNKEIREAQGGGPAASWKGRAGGRISDYTKATGGAVLDGAKGAAKGATAGAAKAAVNSFQARVDGKGGVTT